MTIIHGFGEHNSTGNRFGCQWFPLQSHQASSFQNPFRNKPAQGVQEFRGVKDIMSLPQSFNRSKEVRGYGRYTLFNDDSMSRGWDLRRETWFGDRP